MRDRYEDIQSLNGEVVIISFGPASNLTRWQEETEAPFPLLLDPQRVAYRAYGLERSLLQAWSPKIWYAYARLLLAGRRWRGIQGDSGQLGGDFIVDVHGMLRFGHTSSDPSDRPTVETLLEVLKLNLDY